MDDKMNVGIFLTKEEVAELTSFKRHAQQIRALRLMGLPFLVNPCRPADCHSGGGGRWHDAV